MDHYKSREKKLKELRRNTDECTSSNSALLEQVRAWLFRNLYWSEPESHRANIDGIQVAIPAAITAAEVHRDG